MNNVINNNDRMTKLISVVLTVVFGVLLVSLVANAVTTISTAITTAGDITTTAGALSVGGISTLTGDVTLSGGNGALVITSSNTATSSVAVGCVEMAATSTATKVRLLFTASTTATAISGTQAGFVLWGYGTCPV